jgi:hypothetical protein
LTTGLGMQKLWESWRPATASTQAQLASMLDLEKVASEFVEIATRTRLNLTQLSQVRNSLVEAQRSILLEGADEGDLVQVSHFFLVKDTPPHGFIPVTCMLMLTATRTSDRQYWI